MQLAKVIGTAVATEKHDSLVGKTMLLVAPLMADGKSIDGDPLLVIDSVGARAWGDGHHFQRRPRRRRANGKKRQPRAMDDGRNQRRVEHVPRSVHQVSNDRNIQITNNMATAEIDIEWIVREVVRRLRDLGATKAKGPAPDSPTLFLLRRIENRRTTCDPGYIAQPTGGCEKRGRFAASDRYACGDR